MASSVQYVNDLGERRYQPMLSSGERLWRDFWDETWDKVRPDGAYWTVRYTSRRKAERVAREEERDRLADNWRQTPPAVGAWYTFTAHKGIDSTIADGTLVQVLEVSETMARVTGDRFVWHDELT